MSSKPRNPHAIADPASYDAGIPHELFADLRRRQGLLWTEDTDDTLGFWSVTRMADLVAVSRDHERFSSEVGHIQIYDIDPDVRRVRASMIDLDPPVHTRLRRLVSAAFTPKHVQRHTERIKARVRARVDAAMAQGSFDWVSTIAAPIPIGVICDIMGVPPDDHDLMIEMSDYLVAGTSGAPLDPGAYGNTTPLRELPFNSPAAFGIYDYACRIRAHRLRHPTDDLLSLLATVEVDGEQLNETDYARFFQLMIFAGNETTRSSMAHLALHLVDFADQFQRVRNDPSLLDTAVEEVIRYSSPIIYFRRTATVDTELAGTHVAAGEKVVMWYAAANFDESYFADPLRFDVSRRRVPAHSAFGGGGVHFCLGAPLARIEISALLEEVLHKGVEFRLRDAPTFVRSNFVNGIERLPIEVVR
jgi:cytochrome P450